MNRLSTHKQIHITLHLVRDNKQKALSSQVVNENLTTNTIMNTRPIGLRQNSKLTAISSQQSKSSKSHVESRWSNESKKTILPELKILETHI
jgi:hypothetical protein